MPSPLVSFVARLDITPPVNGTPAHSTGTAHASVTSHFGTLNDPLVALLATVKKAGQPLTPNGSPTVQAATAYSNAYSGNTTLGITGAQTLITTLVASLTIEQISYLTGLGFTKPGDVASERTDIVNSILSSWDAAASSFMKADGSVGFTAALAMNSRLAQFDIAIQSHGQIPVPPDT